MTERFSPDSAHEEPFEMSEEVMTEYERGRRDGMAHMRSMADDVLARTMADELEIEALKARVNDLQRRLRAPAQAAWRPMSTAPRDRTEVLLKLKDRIPSDRDDLRRWDGLIFVGRNHGDIQDWGFAAPVGMGGFPDEWFEGWRPVTDDVPQSASVLERLLTSAKILQQNAEGCAANHYGEDCQLFGMPGWLADTKKDIEAAQEALAGRTQPQAVGTTDVSVPAAALDWLFGAAPDADGKWFGDCADELIIPGKTRPQYWWRSKFRSMIPSLSRPERGSQ